MGRHQNMRTVGRLSSFIRVHLRSSVVKNLELRFGCGTAAQATVF